MKKFYLLFFLLVVFFLYTRAQNFWTGGAGDHLWSSPANWTLGLPQLADQVVIDNLNGEAGSFTVTLPNNLVTVNSITITPSAGNNITLVLPTTNNLQPGLTLNGAGDVLMMNDGGIFKNSTGAPIGNPAINFVDGNSKIRINNGGKFLHNNIRSHSYIIDRLSTVAGTETGIFEFDIPPGNPAQPFVSVSGRIYGTLIFSAVAAGGSKTYLGTGGNDLDVRGDLIINLGANFSPSITGNIRIGRHLNINGNFAFNPATMGANRSIFFFGNTNQNISGNGTFALGANFKLMVIQPNVKVFLQRDIDIPNGLSSELQIASNGALYTGSHKVTGLGRLLQYPAGILGIGSPNGITAPPILLGNIQTATRTFSPTGIFEYNGSAPQVTGNGLPSSVSDLIINNSAGETVTLTSNVNINNQLSLQQGFLATTATEIPTLKNTATIISPNSEYFPYGATNIGWEKSFVKGPVNIEINSNSEKKWAPVGKITVTDTLFAPIALHKFNTNLATYTTEYFPEAHFEFNNVNQIGEPFIDHISSLEYWDISCDVLNNPDRDAKITLSWRPYSKVGTGNPADDPQALADLNIVHYYDIGNGLQWQTDGNNPTFTPNGLPAEYGLVAATANYTTTFISPSFTLGTVSPFNILPVRFLQFSGNENNDYIALQWLTKEESGLAYYDIEKSTDGTLFNKIGTQQAQNSIISNSYNYTDNKPINGINYYRLKIIDAQYKSAYSKVIKVVFDKRTPILVYPNPVNNQLTINLPASSSIYNIFIVNNSGQVVKKLTSKSQNLTIDVGNLSSGVYTINIHNDLQVFSQKFSKQ